MKKYLSVFLLYLSDALPKLILCLCIMAAAECLTVRAGFPEPYLFEDAIDHGVLPLLFMGTFVILYFLLGVFGTPVKTKNEYTFLRLSVNEKELILLQAAADGLNFIALILGQLLLIPLLLKLDFTLHGYRTNGVYLVFARSHFLSVLYPAQSFKGWLLLIAAAAGASLCCAGFSFRMRSDDRGLGMKPLYPFLLTAVIAMSLRDRWYLYTKLPKALLYCMFFLTLISFVKDRELLQDNYKSRKHPDDTEKTDDLRKESGFMASLFLPETNRRKVRLFTFLGFAVALLYSQTFWMIYENALIDAITRRIRLPDLEILLQGRFVGFVLLILAEFAFALLNFYRCRKLAPASLTLERLPDRKKMYGRCFLYPLLISGLAAVTVFLFVLLFRSRYLQTPEAYISSAGIRSIWRLF